VTRQISNYGVVIVSGINAAIWKSFDIVRVKVGCYKVIGWHGGEIEICHVTDIIGREGKTGTYQIVSAL
jgi:hypothetical protein